MPANHFASSLLNLDWILSCRYDRSDLPLWTVYHSISGPSTLSFLGCSVWYIIHDGPLSVIWSTALDCSVEPFLTLMERRLGVHWQAKVTVFQWDCMRMIFWRVGGYDALSSSEIIHSESDDPDHLVWPLSNRKILWY